MPVTKKAVNAALDSLSHFKNRYHEGYPSGIITTRLLKKVVARATESGVEIHSAAYEEAMPEWAYYERGYNATDDVFEWMRGEIDREDVVARIQTGLNAE
jgi:hypothetical protein